MIITRTEHGLYISLWIRMHLILSQPPTQRDVTLRPEPKLSCWADVDTTPSLLSKISHSFWQHTRIHRNRTKTYWITSSKSGATNEMPNDTY